MIVVSLHFGPLSDLEYNETKLKLRVGRLIRGCGRCDAPVLPLVGEVSPVLLRWRSGSSRRSSTG